MSLKPLSRFGSQRWNTLARSQSLFSQWEWLEAYQQQSGRPQSAIILDEAIGPEAAILCAGSTAGDRYDLSRLFGPDLGVADGEPQLILGGTSGYRGGVLLPPTPSRRLAAALAIGAAVEEVAREQAVAGWGMLYLDRATAAELAVHLDHGVARLLQAPGAVVDVEWESFDEYVATRPKSRRTNIVRDLRRTTEAGVAVTVETPRPSLIAEAAPLLSALQRRHGHPSTPDGAGRYLTSFSSGPLERHAVFFVARLRGQVIAFAFAIAFDGTLYVRSAGFDDALARQTAAYFTTCYYEPIRYAVANGLHTIDLGPSAYEAKLLRGARLAPRWALVQARPGRSSTFVDREWNALQRAYWLDLEQHYGSGRRSPDWSDIAPSC